MPFEPPFCPNVACEHHTSGEPGFFRRRGCYRAECRPEAVPRFRCTACRKSFSRQTFRHDYGDRRPDCNQRLVELLTSGVGYRQAGRVLKMNVRSVQHKARKIARTFARLHGNLCDRLPAGRTFVLDEEETYEQASIRTLTMPVLIERETWFVVATAVGTTRRKAKAGSARRRWQDRDEAKSGRRLDQSRESVRTVLCDLDRKLAGKRLGLLSDEKSSYGRLAQQIFGDRVQHSTTPGSQPRTTFNPLFPINTTLAMTLDNCGRLRRNSWLVTKKGAFLQLHMALFVVYRNYIRRRFNHDKEDQTPAKHLGLLPRQLTMSEALAWRQTWGRRSIHPLNHTGSRSGCTYLQDAA